MTAKGVENEPGARAHLSQHSVNTTTEHLKLIITQNGKPKTREWLAITKMEDELDSRLH